MPRNPHKARCAVSGCHNWSMRDSPFCRAHRTIEMGSCGGGAPAGNLNALKTGSHARPLSPRELARIALEVADRPDLMPDRIASVLRSICDRTSDPYLALTALRRLLPALIAALCAILVPREIEAYLRPVPNPHRARMQVRLKCILDEKPPEDRLQLLRKALSQRTGRPRLWRK